MPPAHVDVLTPPGLYGGYGAQATASNIVDDAVRADGYNSPGWKRLQARLGQRGLSQPSEAKNTIIDLDAISAYQIGERVFHQKFGYGAVTGIEGDKLDIAFEKSGAKKVVARFVTSADDVPF